MTRFEAKKYTKSVISCQKSWISQKSAPCTGVKVVKTVEVFADGIRACEAVLFFSFSKKLIIYLKSLKII